MNDSSANFEFCASELVPPIRLIPIYASALLITLRSLLLSQREEGDLMDRIGWADLTRFGQ
jgi:hypothetical protein